MRNVRRTVHIGFGFFLGVLLFCGVAAASTAKGEVSIEKVNYAGWENCYRLSNGEVELIAVADVGPRIVRFAFVNDRNEFSESKSQLGTSGGDQWRMYGGHRLWAAPEATPRTYFPDNRPVEAELIEGSLRLTAPPELDPSFKVNTGLRKEMEVTMHADGHVALSHRITNVGMWPIRLAPWALSVMAPGGRAIIPGPTPKPHPAALLPVRPMAVWGYTDMADPRWIWGRKYIVLKQDPSQRSPQKFGVGNRRGWVAYARAGHLFLKLYDHVEGGDYPDFGCNTELWTNAQILEVETLGPMTTLQPNETAEHVEHWFLFKDVEVTDEESSIDANVMPKVEKALEAIR
jgi:hypothetical protein